MGFGDNPPPAGASMRDRPDGACTGHCREGLVPWRSMAGPLLQRFGYRPPPVSEFNQQGLQSSHCGVPPLLGGQSVSRRERPSVNSGELSSLMQGLIRGGN